jgi:hypothetical protein
MLEFLNNLWGKEPSTNRVVVLVRQAKHPGGTGTSESILVLLKSLKILALLSLWMWFGLVCTSESILGLLKSLKILALLSLWMWFGLVCRMEVWWGELCKRNSTLRRKKGTSVTERCHTLYFIHFCQRKGLTLQVFYIISKEIQSVWPPLFWYFISIEA